MITRNDVAQYVAGHMASERQQAVDRAAAWLVDTKRARQATYLAQDVAALLERDGYVSLKVVTARPLTGQAQSEIKAAIIRLTGAKDVEIQLVTEPGVIGGVRIETPSARIDTTIKRQLTEFIEGATR